MPNQDPPQQTQAPAPMTQGGGATTSPNLGAQGQQGSQIGSMVMELLKQQQSGGTTRPLSHLQAPQPSTALSPAQQAVGSLAQTFIPFAGGAVMYAAKKKKDDQVRQAVGDFQLLDSLWQKAQMAAGNPQDPQYQQKAQQVMGELVASSFDPKRIKNMYKTFYQDQLNPKDTVHSEAAKIFAQQKGAEANVQQMSKALTQEAMRRTTAVQGDPKLQAELLGIAEREHATSELQKTREAREAELERENRQKDTSREAADKLKKQQFEERKRMDDQKIAQFKTTDEYRKDKLNREIATRKEIAKMQMDKAPAALMTRASYARSAYNRMQDALPMIDALEQKGVLGNFAKNKFEDLVFGKGAIDPSLDADTQYQVGQLRETLHLANTALMVAHSNRTSVQIYNDFVKAGTLGQGLPALRGTLSVAMDQSREYADAASTATIESLRGGFNPEAPNTGDAKPKDKSKRKIITNANDIPDAR